MSVYVTISNCLIQTSQGGSSYISRGGGQSGEGVMRRCSGGITMNTALIIIFLPFFVHIRNLLTKYTGEHYKDILKTPSA